MHVVYIQHGNFAEAVLRFEQGLDEVYGLQRYSVDAVVELSKISDQTTVIALNCPDHDILLNNGIRSIGISSTSSARLLVAIYDLCPTHIVLRSPIIDVVRFAISKKIHLLPIFADSFHTRRPRAFLRNRELARLLNNSSIQIVSNHFIPASRSLADIGVNPSKIVPYERPRQISPSKYHTRHAIGKVASPRILYTGTVSKSKGTFDLLAACKILHRRNIKALLTVAGGGDVDTLRAQASSISQYVQILGRITHDEVITQLLSHDIAVIPSRKTYPEGMPNSLFEAIGTRTPVICSDHPVFKDFLQDGKDALFFRGNNPVSLASRVETLVNDPKLYHKLSDNSLNVWSRLQLNTYWHDVLASWLNSCGQGTCGLPTLHDVITQVITERTENDSR